MCALPPGEFEHGRDQPHEKSAVTDEGDVLFRSTFLVAVTGDQLGEHFVRAELAFFVAFKGTIPPA